ncbi:SDR family NAD(P)-dependent oxidoreductase [Diaminobutyricibacter sp. McL0608]|uniref:SDR family NAD(P)-dependent oxidoreductase n=1 Tax=Leifsonia sp. McL0608 TaxID=3143537 RepID=UPI0031F3106D
MLLNNKVAVVYGAGGAIGGAVARAFAAEGADVYVTGHLRESVDEVAAEIVAAGGSAEAAQVDALDEGAIDSHLQSVIDRVGRIDISFNAVGLLDSTVLGVPLTELPADQFVLPITAYATSYFLTARLAARRMVPNRSGVIMTVSALPARKGTALNGGYGPAQAAKEAMTRDLSVELAPSGVRVVAIRPHGIPETATMRHSYETRPPGLTWEQFQAYLAGMTHPRRTMTIAEAANVAAFVASDRASGLTGTVVNLTMGSLDD